MSKELAGRIRKHDSLMADVRQIAGLFEKADRKAVRAAVEKNDFPGLCKALHISEESFAAILKESGARAEKVLSGDSFLAEALRQQPKE